MLVTRAAADLAADVSGVRFEERGAAELKGFEQLLDGPAKGVGKGGTDTLEVAVGVGLHQVGAVFRAAHVRVLGAEELLGELQHQGLVAPWDAEERHHHPQRKPRGDVAHEIARTAVLRHAVDELGDEQLQIGLQPAEARLQEPRLGQRAVDAVVGVVHLDERAHRVGAAARQRPRLLLVG